MKPHPRPPIIRKTIKWGGAAVTVLLVVVWIGSGWWWTQWVFSDWSGVMISRGRVVTWDDKSLQAQVMKAPSSPTSKADRWLGWAWGRRLAFRIQLWSWQDELSDGFAFPVWVLVVASATPAAVAWRLDTLARRRARLNLCPKCNYDRAGLGAGAVCPECGSAGVPT